MKRDIIKVRLPNGRTVTAATAKASARDERYGELEYAHLKKTRNRGRPALVGTKAGEQSPILHVRISKAELEQVRAAANRAGVRLSDYARRNCSPDPPAEAARAAVSALALTDPRPPLAGAAP